MSGAVLHLVALAEAAGFEPELGEWSEATVRWFNALMPRNVRAAGNAAPELTYFDSEGTPHNPAGEGFIDRNTKAAISFLLECKEC